MQQTARVLSSVVPSHMVRPRVAEPNRRAEIVGRMVRDICAGDSGGTYFLHGTGLRFVVGGAGHSVVLRKGAERAEIVAAVLEFVGALPDVASGVGFWEDSSTGRIWLDRVSSHTSEIVARQFAERRGELAIWDSRTETEIRTA